MNESVSQVNRWHQEHGLALLGKYRGILGILYGVREVYQGNRKVYHGAGTQYQIIADMSVLVVSPGFSLVREILSESVSEVNRWHQEHGLALRGKGHVKNRI